MSRSKAQIAREQAARRAAKLKDREMLALEDRLVREGKIYPRGHYRPRGTFRAILAVALALFLGLFIGLGAFFGAGFLVASNVKLNQFGKGIENWIDPDYTDMSLLDFISTVAKDLGGGVKTIGDISKYTPAVDRLLTTLSENMDDLGIDFDEEKREKFKNTAFDKIGEFFMEDIVKTAELGKVAQVGPDSDAILLALCYGEEGTDYAIEDGKIVPLDGGRAPTSINDLIENPTATFNTIRLGTLLGLNKDVSESDLSDNAMMYALCYGKRGVDYEVENGMIKVLADEKEKNTSLAKEATDGKEPYVHTFPTTLDALMNHSNDVINALELGTVLGIDGNVTEQKIEDNGVMYSLAYGSRGTDWELSGNKIEMLDGHGEDYPTKMKAFTENSSNLIQSMEVETLMGVKIDSDKLMHYLAYGPELQKGEEPYAVQDSVLVDKNGKRVDENGYLLNADGGYLTEYKLNDNGEQTNELQYAGGGRYVYEYTTASEGGEKTVSGIKMLPNLDDLEKTYAKKQVKDLTEKEAKLLDGMKLGDVMEIESDASGLMKAIKDWTIEDLKKQEKIESLKISDVIEPEGTSSQIMQAFKERGTTIGELKNQDTIDSLKLSEVFPIDKDSSDIMQAMKNWKIKDLENQNRIERLTLAQVLKIGDDSSGIMKAMKNWRIGDLTDQEKIDSLTLGDVLAIDENSPLLLKTLSDSSLGELSDRVDTLRLSELLGDDELNDNKILKHLKDSTLDSLADDIAHLSVGDVFGDEMYSYMEIKTNQKINLLTNTNGTFEEQTVPTVDYAWLYNNYFGKAGTEKRKLNEGTEKEKEISVQLYHYNYAQYNGLDANGQEDKNAFIFRPTAYTFQKGETLTSQRVLASNKKTPVTAQYYEHGGNHSAAPEGSKIIYDAAAAKYNRTPVDDEGNLPATLKPIYYFEREVVVTPHYKYGIYHYGEDSTKPSTIGELKDLTSGDNGEMLFPYADKVTPKVQQDSAGYYIEVEENGELTRYDLEEVLDRYSIEGTDATFAKKQDAQGNAVDDKTKLHYNGQDLIVRHGTDADGNGYDYITERVGVDLCYIAEGDSTHYTEAQTTELFYAEDTSGNKTPLDRYLSGVWYLLLAEKKDTTVEGDPIDAITFKTDIPILNVDSMISGVSDSMQDTLLAELWFHGFLNENPYTDFSAAFKEGITFVSLGKDGKQTQHVVKNLIEVSLNETLGLVKALVAKIPNVG